MRCVKAGTLVGSGWALLPGEGTPNITSVSPALWVRLSRRGEET